MGRSNLCLHSYVIYLKCGDLSLTGPGSAEFILRTQHRFLYLFTGNDLRLSMWFVFIQQAQARRWWMGSLKFTIGLSLLSYESRQPEAFADLSSFPLAFRFWSWDVLPDIPLYLILSFHHFIYLSAFYLIIKPFGFFLLRLPFVQDWGFAVAEFW